jgi:probable O-glycosylation ligase (exosortase A-associated)
VRDLVLLGVLPFILVAVVHRPFIGLGMWIWTAMFFPNAWVYGIAATIRYNLLFSALAVGVYAFSPDKMSFRWGAISGLVASFFLWTVFTSAASIGIPDLSWEYCGRFFKVVLLFAFIVLIVQKKLHIDFFLWCLVLSVGFYAGLEGLKFVASGGSHQIAGLAGHILGDRNDLALAFVMMLPICVYLLKEFGEQSRLVKLGLIGTIGLMVISVVGTQSRGGMIALLVLVLYLFAKSKRKLSIAVIILIAVGLASSLVTEQWLARMDTISAANQDASFMGRVVAWKLSLILALEHPLFGGGFKTLEFFPVWQHLSGRFHSLPFFYTADAVPDTGAAHAAHSIYFQVMGDHGFVGFGIYIILLVVAFRTAGQVATRARQQGAAPWIASLGTALRLSIFAFCLGGAALSMAYFDLIFAMLALVVVLDKKILPVPLARP